MNMKPTNKVSAGALAGALTLIVTWAIKALTNTEVPAEVGISFSIVLTFIVQWIVTDAPKPSAPKTTAKK